MKNLALLLTLFTSIFFVNAQTGNIQGVITDENGLTVPYGPLVIESLETGVISNANGKYLFVNIPEGLQTIKIQYLGYATKEIELNVKANKTATLNITIEPQAEELDGVEVIGFNRNGQAKALNAQKNKQNITNIISTYQIGKFPDANVGDAVKRIPGITMQVDQGEARNIIVRGLAPELNSVTLNGSRIPSAEGDNRNVQVDLIPSDMIQTIEVNKAITPDMDGDALGGSINLITKSSPESFRLSTSLGSGVSFINNKPILNGSFLVGDKTKNKKFGWMLSASVNDVDFGSDNVEAEWVNEAESPLSGDDIIVAPFVEESDIRTYLVQRIRKSFSVNVDYSINTENKLFLKTMYNWRDDRENRLRLRYRKITPTFASGSETIIGYEGEIRRQTKGGIDNHRNKNRRLEDQRMQNYSLGGNHIFGSLEVNWMSSYAKASEERLNERYVEFELENAIPLNVNASNPRFPSFSAVNATDVSLDNFVYKEVTEENQHTQEEDFNTFIDFKLPVNFLGTKNGFVKFGVRFKSKNKNRENDFSEYNVEDAFPTLASVPTKDYTKLNFLAGNKYQAGLFADETWLGSLNLVDGEALPEEFEAGNYDAKEEVYAAYFMASQNISDKASILFGMRIENTTLTSIGNEVTYDTDGDFVGSSPIDDHNSYTNFLPGIHLKYNIQDNTVLRFAWTNTLARPNYVDLVPFKNILNEDEEIEIGNADLDPTTAMNFDIMAEHYFKSVGIIYGGFFYKDIKDFTYTSLSEDVTTGYDLFQPLNGDSATIFGAEFAFQRQLDFLPGFAIFFSIYLNYTVLTSSTEGIRNGDELREEIDLPGTSPNMFNGSLGYADKKYSIRLSANYSDAYIDELGEDTFTDRYYDEQFFLDLSASFTINKSLRIYADLNNITNRPLRYYQGVKDRTQQVEFYEKRLTFGLKYDLFKK